MFFLFAVKTSFLQFPLRSQTYFPQKIITEKNCHLFQTLYVMNVMKTQLYAMRQNFDKLLGLKLSLFVSTNSSLKGDLTPRVKTMLSKLSPWRKKYFKIIVFYLFLSFTRVTAKNRLSAVSSFKNRRFLTQIKIAQQLSLIEIHWWNF